MVFQIPGGRVAELYGGKRVGIIFFPAFLIFLIPLINNQPKIFLFYQRAEMISWLR
jgi:hypothetical protein